VFLSLGSEGTDGGAAQAVVRRHGKRGACTGPAQFLQRQRGAQGVNACATVGFIDIERKQAQRRHSRNGFLAESGLKVKFGSVGSYFLFTEIVDGLLPEALFVV
jgi:hypothetical protein